MRRACACLTSHLKSIIFAKNRIVLFIFKKVSLYTCLLFHQSQSLLLDYCGDRHRHHRPHHALSSPPRVLEAHDCSSFFFSLLLFCTHHQKGGRIPSLRARSLLLQSFRQLFLIRKIERHSCFIIAARDYLYIVF